MSSTEFTVDSREIQFILREWLHIEQLSQYEAFKDFDADTMDLLVKEGHNFTREVLAPSRVESDRVGCKIVDGNAIVPECIVTPYKKAYELGWASISAKPHFGGQGAPLIIGMAIREAVIGANLGLAMYFGLTEGAAGLIEAFGSEFLKEKYVKKMITGVFTGTMCLSEPQAGSDVGAGTTTAEATGDGRYKIKGTKCWISSGDNNLGTNVIHAVLARIKGAPQGTRGLSLFVVPKYLVNDDGSVGPSNDVNLGSIEHKMGINCSVTALLNFGENDNCYGWLLGGENEGMTQMFKMMNEARMGVGTMGIGVGAAAYQNALAYAKERLQGSHINKLKDANAPRVAIIEHPDVKLQLLGMKAKLEGMRALLYSACLIWDKSIEAPTPEERQENEDMLQMLMPMCKGWCTEAGVEICSAGMQVLGGVGYTRDFPLEQLYRDLRISTIYEGTTGIQALDLVGRKMTMRNGEMFMKLMGRFNTMAEENKSHPGLGKVVSQWATLCESMADCAMGMQSMMSDRGFEGAVLYATPFLYFISGITSGYFLLQQGMLAYDKLELLKKEHNIDAKKVMEFAKSNQDASFYYNKIKTVEYFVTAIIPVYESAAATIKQRNYIPLEINF